MAEPDTEERPEGETAAALPEPGEAPRERAPADPAEAVEPAKHPSSRPVAPAAPAATRAADAEDDAVTGVDAPPPPVAVPAVPAVPPAVPQRAERASGKEPVARAAAASFPPSGRTSVKTAITGSGPLAAYEAVARSARLPDLVAITQKILGEAAAERRTGWDYGAKVAAAADEAKLARADADTAFGNVLDVLGSGADGEPQRALASSLYAHAIAEARRDDDSRLASDVLWLATHSAFDATPLLDRALGDEADDLWTAIGDRIRRIDDGKVTSAGRAEAIVGCAALSSSESAVARKVAADLAPRLHDATLSRLLGVAVHSPRHEVRLEGEAMSAPRGPVLTTILALTGILFAMHALRLVARIALAYRTPAEVSLSEEGVRMRTRIELLGRTLREREHVIVRSGLVRVVREVRYPRAAFYAGLLALALGSYVGVRAFVDGVRAASPSLLLSGLVVVALGIAADFILGSVLPGGRGRVRVVFVPRTGKALCVGDVEASVADDALARALSAR